MQIEVRKDLNRLKTIFAGLLYLTIVIFVAAGSLKQGLSEYFIHSAKSLKSDIEAEKAISFDPTNPDAHEIRGFLFLQNQNYTEALSNFKSAADLRPGDYLLWLRLGYCHYKMRDFNGAISAYEKALSLAPNYARPKRYMGRLFLKTGNPEKAFVYLSKSSAINDEYLPEALHLARKNLSGNPVAIEQALHPDSVEAKKQMALYFIKHDIMSDSIKTFLIGDELDKESKNELIKRLIEVKNFYMANEIWKSANILANSENTSNENLMYNGDFETEIDLNEKNFGWLIDSKIKNIDFKIDGSQAFSKKIALHIQFNGNSVSEKSVLSQLLTVSPNQNYQLSFVGRTRDLVTGGLPIVIVNDANEETVLGMTPLDPEESDWKKYVVNFSTKNQTTAVIISLQRLKCNSNACPAFGHLWLDDFQLKIR